MAWNLVASFSGAAIQTAIDGGVLAPTTSGQYAVSSGVLHRDISIGNPPDQLVYTGLTALLTKVELDIAPISKQAAAGSSDVFQAYGGAHDTGNTDQGLCGGLRTSIPTSQVAAGFHNGGAFAVSSTDITVTNGDTPTVIFEVTAATGSSSDTLATIGADTQADTGRAQAPLAGKPSIIMSGSTAAVAANGITAIRFYQFVSATMSCSPSVFDIYQRVNGHDAFTLAVTLTGVGTTWLSVGPSLSISGLTSGSIDTVSVVSDTVATFHLHIGSAGYVGTITDATSGATCNVLIGEDIIAVGDGTNIALSLPDNWSGVSGITFQWQTSGSDPVGTMVNIGGATTRTISVAPGDDVLHYYLCNVSYDGATTIISQGFTNGVTYWVRGASRIQPPVPTFPSSPHAAYRVACPGDSITSPEAVAAFKAALEASCGNTCTVLDQGRAGSQFSDWQKTAPPFGGDPTNLYAQLIAAISGAGGVDYITIALGRNDVDVGTSTATINALRTQLVADLHADIPGIIIQVEWLIYYVNFGDNHAASNAYNNGIALGAGQYFVGAGIELQQFFSDQTYLIDGKHPTTDGAVVLGKFWARKFLDSHFGDNILAMAVLSTAQGTPVKIKAANVSSVYTIDVASDGLVAIIIPGVMQASNQDQPAPLLAKDNGDGTYSLVTV